MELVRLACYAVFIHLIAIIWFGTSEDDVWVVSDRVDEWYSPYDKCILSNSSHVDIDEILSDCKLKFENSSVEIPPDRCTVGNSWRGPRKTPFCSTDIPFSDREFFRWTVKGYDDPNEKPLERMFREVSRANGAVLMLGDSLMQQFHTALVCEMEREKIWPYHLNVRNSEEIKYVDYRSEGSEYHRVPLKFTPVFHFVNSRHDRIPHQSLHNMKNIIENFLDKHDALILIVNMGLHFVSNHVPQFSRQDYVEQMTMGLSYLHNVSLTPNKKIAVFWRETSAQHFDTENGYWPGARFVRDMGADCVPIKDPSPAADWRNADIRQIVQDNHFSNVRVIPFYNLSVPLWNLHVNGHLRDCTHFCWSPMMYQRLFHYLADYTVEFLAKTNVSSS